MNKTQFMEWIDPRLKEIISRTKTISGQGEVIIYWILKPDIIPKVLQPQGITNEYLEHLKPWVTWWRVIVSLPTDAKYKKFLPYKIMDLHFQKELLRPEREEKSSINDRILEAIDNIIYDYYRLQYKDNQLTLQGLRNMIDNKTMQEAIINNEDCNELYKLLSQ